MPDPELLIDTNEAEAQENIYLSHHKIKLCDH